ncbi:MAG: hypothetical protein KDB27_29490, partial [Planctomycetales bacterium]|nr:hypothetical protein [Planctomycetales bacterium]
VMVEAEPNEREHATRVSLPVEYSGTLYPRRDQDWIRFQATKGQQLQIEVHSSPMGIEIDPAVYVWQVGEDGEGKESFANRNVTDDSNLDGGRYGRRVPRGLDYAGTSPSVRFTVPEDGDYCVSVRDLYGNARSDPRATYRLAVTLAKPSFSLIAWTQRYRVENNNKRVERASLALLPGESREVLVDVIRHGGFNGPLTLEAANLPAGVTSSKTTVAPGQTEAAIVLAADTNAKPSYAAIEVVGTAAIEDETLVRSATFGVLTDDTGNIGAQRPSRRPAERVFVSVKSAVERPPIVVSMDDNQQWRTSVGGTLNIPVKYTRNAEVKGELKLNSIELPGEIKPKELVLKNDANDGTLEIPLNNAKVQPGRYTFYLTGQVAANITRNQAAISEVEKQLAEFGEQLKGYVASEQSATASRDDATKRVAEVSEQTEKEAAQKTLADAEEALKAASEKKQRAEQFRKSLEERLNNTKKQDGPRDAQVVVTSTAVTIDVAKSPVTVDSPEVKSSVPESGEVDANGELKISRDFGFADAVEISATIPDKHPPLTIESIGKDATATKLSFKVASTTAPGRYEYPLKLKLKFGGIDIEDTATVALVVDKPSPETTSAEAAASSPVQPADK